MTKKWTVTLEISEEYPTEFHSGLIRQASRQASRLAGREKGLPHMDVETAIIILISKGVDYQGLVMGNSSIVEGAMRHE